jgi:hypothetical protein
MLEIFLLTCNQQLPRELSRNFKDRKLTKAAENAIVSMDCPAEENSDVL